MKYLNEYVRTGVGIKWYDLGIDLLDNDDVEELTIIQSQNSDNINTCCTKMFQLWLSRQPTASWNQLIISLKKPHIGLNYLATNIEHMLSQPTSTGTYVCM